MCGSNRQAPQETQVVNSALTKLRESDGKEDKGEFHRDSAKAPIGPTVAFCPDALSNVSKANGLLSG
jgi:hypothetical protein